MTGNLIYGLLTMGVCLFLQSFLLLLALRYYIRHERHVASPSFLSTIAVLNTVMMILVVGNLSQLAMWAGLFRLLGEFSTFREAVYHSAVNFTTLGYGDIVMSEKRRLLGPIEAMNGVIMIGVSTAALMTILQDALKKTVDARQSARGS